MGKGRGQTVATLLLAVAVAGAAPAQAAPANPVPLTDLFASQVPLWSGGTKRACATSGLGFRVTCVENVRRMPSAAAGASGVTFGHWVFCRRACSGSLLVHELVHVRQFETHGDLFGPRYLAEAALHGTGCENQWERPAYEASGGC